MQTTPDFQSNNAIVIWLAICCVLVFAMVLLGGAVRLTGSGLSMVDWKPLMGVIPPLDDTAWQAVFDQYKNYPEYKSRNMGMELGEFKFIYLMEYAHRLLGRGIGLVFLVPFLIFLWRRNIGKPLALHLWAVFVLGGVQGLVGWYMVKSGLVDVPRVSQYRLALHLMLAIAIYVYMIRIIIGVMDVGTRDNAKPPALGNLTLILVLTMVASGAFVAGTHAGFIYNTFPKMGGQWIPDQIWALQPGWKNLLENPIAIQFTHRCLAVVVSIIVTAYACQNFLRGGRFGTLVAIAMFAAVVLQVSLGISTLLSGVPVALGVAHQGGAMLLLATVVVALSSDLPRLQGKSGK